jgi:hypothetical protein
VSAIGFIASGGDAPLLPSTHPSTNAADEPARAFKEYVSAVKTGKIDAAAKMIHAGAPDPKQSAWNSARMAVAVESVKNAMRQKFGPQPDGEVDGWNMGIPDDRFVATAASRIHGDHATVDLASPDGAGERFFDQELVRIDGHWMIDLKTEPATPGTPKNNELARMTELAKLFEDGSRQIIAELQAGQLKTPAEVQNRLEELTIAKMMAKAPG